MLPLNSEVLVCHAVTQVDVRIPHHIVIANRGSQMGGGRTDHDEVKADRRKLQLGPRRLGHVLLCSTDLANRVGNITQA